MANLPDWLLDRPSRREPAPARRSFAPGRLVRRSLSEFAGLLSRPLLSARGLEASGYLQRLDPRAKVVGLVGLIVLTTWLTTWRALALDAVLCSILLAGSKIPLKSLSGTWLAVPFFSIFLMLPATLNLVTPGEVVLPLWTPGRDWLGPWALPEVVGITGAGLEAGARFVSRSLLCVTFALLLTCTTRPDRLFRGLRALGVPKVFVLLLTMMERYLWVLARSAEEIHLAKLSRTLVPVRLRQEQAWVAAGAGALFRKSRSLGNAVYLAMQSRGFTGEVRLLEEARWRLADAGFIAAAAAGCALVLCVERWP